MDRGQPFEFTIGVGQVIRGWDEGVMKVSRILFTRVVLPCRAVSELWHVFGMSASIDLRACDIPIHPLSSLARTMYVRQMSLGEKAKLDITPDFGYGARGAGGVIPPNADLVFEVELLGINEGGGGSSCTIL